MADDVDGVRARATLMLGDAVRDETALYDVAREIERRALERADGDANSKRYRECVRTLATNLRRNDALAARVRRGEADIEALVRADATELATEAVKAARAAAEERCARRRTRRHFDDGVNTEAYACPMCENVECRYVMVSGGRDIRKAEIWGGGERESLVLVQCLRCQHEFRERVL